MSTETLGVTPQSSCFSKAGRYANSIWNVAKPNTFCKALTWCSAGIGSVFGGGYFLFQASQHQNLGLNLTLGILLAVSGAMELSTGLLLPQSYAEEAQRNERTPLTQRVEP